MNATCLKSLNILVTFCVILVTFSASAADQNFESVDLTLHVKPADLPESDSNMKKFGNLLWQPFKAYSENNKELNKLVALKHRVKNQNTLSYELGHPNYLEQTAGLTNSTEAAIGVQMRASYQSSVESNLLTQLPFINSLTSGLKFNLGRSSTPAEDPAKQDNIRYGLELQSMKMTRDSRFLMASVSYDDENMWLMAPEAQIAWNVAPYEVNTGAVHAKKTFHTEQEWTFADEFSDQTPAEQLKQKSLIGIDGKPVDVDQEKKEAHPEYSQADANEQSRFDFSRSVRRWSSNNEVWQNGVQYSMAGNIRPASSDFFQKMVRDRKNSPWIVEFKQPQDLLKVKYTSPEPGASRWAALYEISVPVADTIRCGRKVTDKGELVETSVTGLKLGTDSRLNLVSNDWNAQKSMEITTSVDDAGINIQYRTQAKDRLKGMNANKVAEQYSIGLTRTF